MVVFSDRIIMADLKPDNQPAEKGGNIFSGRARHSDSRARARRGRCAPYLLFNERRPKGLTRPTFENFSIHFARKTFNTWAGLKTDSRICARDDPCRTGHRLIVVLLDDEWQQR
jgi:hypothetical protein